jgi:hypothetical protein
MIYSNLQTIKGATTNPRFDSGSSHSPWCLCGSVLSAKKWGCGHLLLLLVAVGDDTLLVVLEVSEAPGAVLDEFYLSVEALGDAVVFGEAPHGDEGLFQVVEGFPQGHEFFFAGLAANDSLAPYSNPHSGHFARSSTLSPHFLIKS